MDNNNWRPPQAEPAGEDDDWRSKLQADSRQRIVSKIMDTLRRHLPFPGPEGLQELRKIAMRFEEKIYTAATSQTDYLRKISLKMLTMESKSQNTLPNALSSNSTGVSKNLQDPASSNMQPQVHSQAPSLPIPIASNESQAQVRQQLSAQNIQNNIASAGMQSSAGLPTALPPANALTQNSVPNVSQHSNLQNISSISQSSVGNSLGQGVSSSMFTNAQRQLQGRQHSQPVGSQQQAQNSQQYIYQQHLQHQILKQKMQQGNIQTSLLQPHVQQQQQQNLLQQTQLQSSQQSVMQTSSVMQPSMISGLLQNQQSSIQQPAQSVLQQHQQAVLRQQRQPQPTTGIHQSQAQMPQQSMLTSQQQPQQLVGQQSSVANMPQSQLIAQQSSIPDLQQQQQQQQPQQQRLLAQSNNHPSVTSQQLNNHPNLQQQQLMSQQNNLSNMHQQQLGSQNHVGGLAQQQQLLGTQSSNSGMLVNQPPGHIMQQSKLPVQQQSQDASALLQGGAQQSQPQSQQQLMSQIQSQPSQLQQQLGLQQQPNSMQHNMQQRLQPSTSLLQQQNVIDQQKQMFQSQRTISEAPSTSLDSTAQTGNTGDWQEEVYQKIKVMKNEYYGDLTEMFQKISIKLHQHDSLPQPPRTEQVEKLKKFKQMLEHLIQFLQVSKNNISTVHKDKLASYEKQIITFLNTNRPRRAVSLQQGQLPPPHMQPMQQGQQSHAQVPPAQSHDNGMNPQLQSLNLQNSVPPMQQSNMANLQHGSVPSLPAIASSQQNIINSLQSGPSLDSGQGNTMSPMQPVNMGSLQQNPLSASQQATMNSMPVQSGVNLLHANINSLQSNSNMLQNQHLKQQQEQQISQLKQQYQQRHIQHQLLQKQQIMQQQQQQQQLHQQTKQQQQQPGQMQAHQMPQLHQLSDMDLKMRQGIGLKSGVLQQHLSQGQRYPHQQVKPGASLPISSPQLLQAVSPQINQHSSPQIDQQNMLPPLTKVGTPLQSANSPFVVPSPPTPLAPSPMPGDSEKPNSVLSSVSNTANIGHQQTAGAPPPPPSLAIGTPGISASPLLAEFPGSDGNHVNASTVSAKSSVTEQPLERLLKAVKSISSKALHASVNDIGSVVSMIDRIAGSAPGNGSRAAVGEDLVAMTKCRLQARNFITQDGGNGTKRMRRYTSAMPLNVVSSAGSVNDSFKRFTGSDTSELESTATSNIKRLKTEANHTLLEEIREINERLIDTVVDISEEDIDPTIGIAAAEGGEGTVVKCSFTAVALCPELKSQYASAQMSPIQPLRLLVPANYPNCSPILLDKFPVEASKEYEDLSVKAKSKFSISLRTLSQPMSLKEIARTWDDCTRAVISEYAQQNGGGTFSSKYGTWENCLSAA